MTQTMPARSTVPNEHTWDIASVFPSDAAWEAEIAALGGRHSGARRVSRAARRRANYTRIMDERP